MTEHTIREARVSDAEQLIMLWVASCSLIQGHGGYSPRLDQADAMANILGMVSNQDDVFKFWVAEAEGGQLLGYSTTQPMYMSPDSLLHKGFGLIMTYVHPQHIGDGIGTILSEHNLAYCRNETSLKYVIGFLIPTNIRSKSIVGRLGFETIGRMPHRADMPTFDIIVLSL